MIAAVKKASGWVGKFSGTGLGYDTVGPNKVKRSFTLTLKTVSVGKVAGSVKTKWGTVSFNTNNVSLQKSYLIFIFQRWDGTGVTGQLHLSKDGRTVQGELDVLANGHNLMFDVKLKRK